MLVFLQHDVQEQNPAGKQMADDVERVESTVDTLQQMVLEMSLAPFPCSERNTAFQRPYSVMRGIRQQENDVCVPCLIKLPQCNLYA